MARATPHDLTEIESLFKAVRHLLKKAKVNLNGFTLNAYPGFDGVSFYKSCANEKIIPNVNRTADAAQPKK